MDEETIREIAKATGKTMDLARASGHFLDEVLGGPFRQLGSALHDQARLFRLKNFYKVTDKARMIIEERRRAEKPVPLPPESLLPIMDGASLESNECVQSLWAGLLANATDPDRKLNVHKIFVETLRGLEPIDAQILEFLDGPGYRSAISSDVRHDTFR